jgi:hypothetical protein
MEVHFTPDQEARLAQIGTKADTDAEWLVKKTVLGLLEDEAALRANVLRTNGRIAALASRQRRPSFTDARSTTVPVEPGLVGSVALRAGHDASVADDQIERRANGNQEVGAKRTAASDARSSSTSSSPPPFAAWARTCSVAAVALFQIPRGADNLGTAAGEGAVHLPKPCRYAGDQNAHVAQVHVFKHFVHWT